MLRFLKSALGFGLVAMATVVLLSPTPVRAVEEAPASHTSLESHAPASGHDAEGGHGAPADPMEFQPGLAVWTLAVFVGLLAVLGKFAWAPLIQALHNREEHLEHCLKQTENARNEAERLLAEHRKAMADADDKIRDLIHQAQRKAETRAADLLRQAQTDADAVRDRAQRDIATARDQALSEIWTRTADVAVSVAGRVLSKQLGDDDRRRLLDEAIRELPAGSPTGGSSA